MQPLLRSDKQSCLLPAAKLLMIPASKRKWYQVRIIEFTGNVSKDGDDYSWP